jgi:hypothetical protein
MLGHVWQSLQRGFWLDPLKYETNVGVDEFKTARSTASDRATTFQEYHPIPREALSIPELPNSVSYSLPSQQIVLFTSQKFHYLETDKGLDLREPRNGEILWKNPHLTPNLVRSTAEPSQ